MYGVNMRHLGKVASRTSLPHIKEMCITDMIARTTKKILRAHLAQFILFYSSNAADYSLKDFLSLKDFYLRKSAEG